MRGIWLENQQVTLKDGLPLPEIAAGEALIRLRLAGICSTDLEMARGYYPYRGILGHEFVGEVVEAPGDPSLAGKRVVGEINITCGYCQACLSGRPTHCENRRTLGIHDYDGVFADFLKLPIRNLHLVPEALSDEQAVFTELLAAALEIQEQIQVKPGMRVLVVGAGRLGLLIAQTLKLTGCNLQVVARRQAPKELLDQFGIPWITPQDISAHMADLVVEVTGSAEGFALSRKAVRPRGTLLLKSTFAGDVSLNLSAIVVDEITLLGSRCGPFAPALRLLESGLVDPLPLVSARYPLAEGIAALEKAAEPGVLKVLLYP